MIIKPDMAKYRETGMAVREHFRALTGNVEPLSIDEAFLDLSGVLEQEPALELAGWRECPGSRHHHLGWSVAQQAAG